jgi:hypothetical protein
LLLCQTNKTNKQSIWWTKERKGKERKKTLGKERSLWVGEEEEEEEEGGHNSLFLFCFWFRFCEDRGGRGEGGGGEREMKRKGSV